MGTLVMGLRGISSALRLIGQTRLVFPIGRSAPLAFPFSYKNNPGVNPELFFIDLYYEKSPLLKERSHILTLLFKSFRHGLFAIMKQ